MVILDEKFLTKRWFALNTKCHHERKVAALLDGKGVETFLPTRSIQRKWKDRRKLVDFPLFPGYLFVHMPLLEKINVIQTPSVVKIVGTREPEPMPDEQITAVRRFVAEEIEVDPYPYLLPGRDVEVMRGPLKGVRGVLSERRGKYRLIVNIHLINSLVETAIDAEDVRVL